VLARGEPDSYEASATDITAQMQLQDQLAKAAEHDPLTGALNRLGLSSRLATILESSQDIEHIALCYIDLDRFKMLNDMFGHNAGDSVLVNVVRRIEATLGPEAIISRLGGDEFIIVLPPADQSVQEGLAWKALESITEEPFALDGKSFSVTASIGVFHLVPHLSQAELIAGADRSCQEAKRKGRNQVVMCADSKQLVQQRQGELSLVARLHDEATFDEFELVAQPIVGLDSSRKIACEILLRHRSEDTLQPAGPLIAAAEQNGEMACIDRWVLRRSLEWLSDNAEATQNLQFVSVNLSGSSLNDEFFKTFVIALLQKHQNIADRIVLEVTESVAMQDIFMMMKFIESVRQTGARIALDDFGSGYSNFASLTDVQASFLKIDGRFVNSLQEKGSAASIIRTIGILAHELQMECIAEWVEDVETLQLLKSIGIDYGQGHILTRPVSLSEILQTASRSDLNLDANINAILQAPSDPEPGSKSILSGVQAHSRQPETTP
jgi:diguanylate cyclase (GGDEF)-like protein